MDIKSVAVVGGGTMGAGIIQALSNFELPVAFKEINEDLVKKCLDQVNRIYISALKKGKITEAKMKNCISLAQGGTDYNGFEKADLVIEAVPEDLEVKQKVFIELDRICKPEAIFASNTSALSITKLASFVKKREVHVIGMHWFNPAHIMRLIEITPGITTSEDVVAYLTKFCLGLGKVPIRVKECAGFLVNRLLGIYSNEALFMVEEGKKPVDIDQAALSLGMPIGPLSLVDRVGWDVVYHANQTLYEEYGARFALPDLMVQIVKDGRLGVKTGKGIYMYEIPSDGLPIKKESSESSISESMLKEFSERLLLVWINEGIRCLDEGVAEAKDIDLALQIGTGVPKGPLSWADDLGLDVILNALEQKRNCLGDRFWPSPLLKRKVYAGHLGKKVGKGFFDYRS